MDTSMTKEITERKKVKKKMSKAQMQLAIIKKKQCDAKALKIVEQLIEPTIDHQWLLCNIKHISKSHMEDVIEERAIIKLCGYVLCSNELTIITDQRYRISTRQNKVYDITRRKNFCSSRCYGACNYLLEQMLTSPLWLRDKEVIPEFKILSAKDELVKSIPGDEIRVNDIDAQIDNINKHTIVSKEQLQKNIEEKSNNVLDSSIHAENKNSIIGKAASDDINPSFTTNEYTSLNCVINTYVEDLSKNVVSVNEDITPHINDRENNELYNEFESDGKVDAKSTDAKYEAEDHVQEENKSNFKNHKQKNTAKREELHEFYNLAVHIEQSVKEWITEDTICLLSGEEGVKNRLLDNIVQHDRYLHLCKKLNKLQLDDEKDNVDLTSSSLKPLPHLSVLQEEGKKMELKVRAFYKGNMVTENSENNLLVTNHDNEDFTPVLPLTEAHAPKTLRRRIFFDKLSRILPDLLRTLSNNKFPEYVYNSEKCTLIKVLVNTFSLTAANIIFKTAEWTLVGLIIIKMLSMIDTQLKLLLSSKQATMYISMILMSYKLDSNYLERLIAELTNKSEICNSVDDTN